MKECEFISAKYKISNKKPVAHCRAKECAMTQETNWNEVQSNNSHSIIWREVCKGSDNCYAEDSGSTRYKKSTTIRDLSDTAHHAVLIRSTQANPTLTAIKSNNTRSRKTITGDSTDFDVICVEEILCKVISSEEISNETTSTDAKVQTYDGLTSGKTNSTDAKVQKL